MSTRRRLLVKRVFTLAMLALVPAGLAWLLAFEDGRHALRVLRYEWFQGMPMVWSIPRRIRDCPAMQSSRRLVVLAFGQSNAANSVRGRHRAERGVLNFHAGRCYAGEDPVPGATGTGGSVWNRLGDLLIASGRYDSVVLASIALDSSAIAQWSPGGDQHPRLLAALEELRAHDLEPTHLLWHQGERDMQLGTDVATYAGHFSRLVASIRDAGFEAPVHVALASYCGGRRSEQVRTAQRGVPETVAGVQAGPDTDVLLGPALRHDDCHFSAAGAARHAALWRDALLAGAR